MTAPTSNSRFKIQQPFGHSPTAIPSIFFQEPLPNKLHATPYNFFQKRTNVFFFKKSLATAEASDWTSRRKFVIDVPQTSWDTFENELDLESGQNSFDIDRNFLRRCILTCRLSTKTVAVCSHGNVTICLKKWNYANDGRCVRYLSISRQKLIIANVSQQQTFVSNEMSPFKSVSVKATR